MGNMLEVGVRAFHTSSGNGLVKCIYHAYASLYSMRVATAWSFPQTNISVQWHMDA